MKYTYVQFFEKFPNIFAEVEAIVDHAGNFREELKHQNLLENVNSLLSIGAGEGKLEIQLCRDENINVGYIDPSPKYVNTFKENVKKMGLESRVLKVFPDKFENYSCNKKYDLIISIHSWYAFEFNRELLEKALFCLAQNGHLFITIVSKTSLTWKLANLAKNTPTRNLHSEELSEWATKEGFDHRYVINHKIILYNVFFEDGQITKEGKAFASFLSFTPWEEMTQKLRTDIINLFESEREDNYIDLKCGCLIF